MDVTATDKATGKEQKIQITASTNLSDAEIDNMVQSAEQNEAEDQKLRELIEARNTADQVIYSVEKSLGELNGQVADTEKSRINEMIGDLKTAVSTEDTAHIKQLTEQLQQASMALGQQLYQQQQVQRTSQTAMATAMPKYQANDEDVVEGEFQEM